MALVIFYKENGTTEHDTVGYDKIFDYNHTNTQMFLEKNMKHKTKKETFKKYYKVFLEHYEKKYKPLSKYK